MEAAITIFIVLVAFVFVLDRSLRSKGYRGPASSHFNGTIFFNITQESLPPTPSGNFWRFARWMLTRRVKPWVDRRVAQTIPRSRVLGSELIVTLVNHATVLIQTGGINIITDPVYAKRVSPFTFLGPRRHINPGIAFDDLPPIDAVLVSHNHYDHLDTATLKRLARRNNPMIYVPLGNKKFLAMHNIMNVTELDWWDSAPAQTSQGPSSTQAAIHCVPAQHFSARALSDRNKTLWCGYVIHTSHGDLYFAGDTGLGPFADQIAKRYPAGFRLGLLPIGAFLPRWAMQSVHTGPVEALAMQKQLRIKEAVAIHFGTFALADDGQDEPANLLQELLAVEKAPIAFHILENGASVSITVD